MRRYGEELAGSCDITNPVASDLTSFVSPRSVKHTNLSIGVGLLG